VQFSPKNITTLHTSTHTQSAFFFASRAFLWFCFVDGRVYTIALWSLVRLTKLTLRHGPDRRTGTAPPKHTETIFPLVAWPPACQVGGPHVILAQPSAFGEGATTNEWWGAWPTSYSSSGARTCPTDGWRRLRAKSWREPLILALSSVWITYSREILVRRFPLLYRVTQHYSFTAWRFGGARTSTRPNFYLLTSYAAFYAVTCSYKLRSSMYDLPQAAVLYNVQCRHGVYAYMAEAS
jgi:hypothetical protein